MQKVEYVSVSKIRPDPKNPRIIKDTEFKRLCDSIKDSPDYFETRPILVDKDMVIFAGNMRYKAAVASGLKEVPVAIMDVTEEKRREYMIRDNVNNGAWDWDILANEWDADDLTEWGVTLPTDGDDGFYTRNITAPIYEPSGEKPKAEDLVSVTKALALMREIEESDIPEEDKGFLKVAAARHYVFDYAKVADYYAYSDDGVKKLMEDSALVIIDFEKAIELGYVSLTKEITRLGTEDHG